MTTLLPQKPFLQVTRNTTNRDILLLIIITSACLIPFLNKPFHIDDPLFIWIAQHIKDHPLDFYGFTKNWNGFELPMYEITRNPPLTSYYLAVVGNFLGWTEAVFHAALLPAAVGTVLGMYVLAKLFCSRPIEATLIGVLTPVFLISGTTIMCDMIMLCFWTWTIVLWIQGIKTGNTLKLLTAALFLTIASLAKYFAMNLIPLILFYTLVEKKRIDFSLLFLLIPIATLGGYHWLTQILYGHGLLIDAARYATKFGAFGQSIFSAKLFTGPSFLGGSFISVLLFMPRTWKRRELSIWLFLTAGIVFALSQLNTVGKFPIHEKGGIRWDVIIEGSLMAIAGSSILVIAIIDFINHRNSDSLMLLMWILGTFLFATFINWTVNGRSLLPIAPVVGILIVRRMEVISTGPNPERMWYRIRLLIPAAGIALLTVYADYSHAETAKKAAEEISDKYSPASHSLWFEGHWGFQYYMELQGGKPLKYANTRLSRGEILIIPWNNTGNQPLRSEIAPQVEKITLTPYPWTTCMNYIAGAGFYSDIFGPLPYVFTTVRDEVYSIYIIAKPVDLIISE